MEMSEVLCLKWNNHKSIFLQNLSSLRTQELYSDATITCSGKYFSVHRLVLSTCSEYFEEIFERISMQSIHPFIIVTNIESGYLEALLNFMYNGEVNVLHEMLPGLIKAAEILKIKGLAVPDEEAIEKELIYAREREANNVPKEGHIKSPPRQSPIHRPQQPQQSPLQLVENPPSNCILPDDMTHQGMVLPPLPKNESAMPVDVNNIYHGKDEIVEMCPIESPADYIASRQEELSNDSQNEIKLENDPLTNVSENIPPLPPPQHLVPPPQHFPPPPPAHSQILPPPEPELSIQEPLPPQHYSPPIHQAYGNEVIKGDYDLNHQNAKASPWEVAQTNKEIVESNVAAAAVVQEVIQGLLLQSEPEPTCGNHENGGMISPPIHMRHPMNHEDDLNPDSTLQKSKAKRRNSASSPNNNANVTPKKCPKCPYITKYVSTLRRHIMFKHTGEKPHKCQFCPYRSAHNFNMKKHMMIHTGEKPFSCPLCSYKAAQNSNIKSHMKSHEKKFIKAALKTKTQSD